MQIGAGAELGERPAIDITRFGKRFLDGKPLNDHYKYSLQLSLYTVIFTQQTGLPIESCRLLQIHPDLDGHRWIDATDLTTEARELLRDAHVAL